MSTSLMILIIAANAEALPACAPVLPKPPPPPPVVVVPSPPVTVPAPPPVVHPCPPGLLRCPRYAQPPPAWPPVYQPPIIRCPYPYVRRAYRCVRVTRYRRPYRPYRPPPFRDNWPYHRKSTPYLGIEPGYFALFPGDTAYRYLQPTIYANAFFGWNFTRVFGLEIGVGGAHMVERDDGLGGLKRAGNIAVTLDAKLRLIRPSPRKNVVPFLQFGTGVYWFGGERPDADQCGGKSCILAHGGGLHAGGGLDIYLFRGGILGLRVLYRHLFMSQLKCPAGTPCAAVSATDDPVVHLPSLTATVNFTIFWSHL